MLAGAIDRRVSQTTKVAGGAARGQTYTDEAPLGVGPPKGWLRVDFGSQLLERSELLELGDRTLVGRGHGRLGHPPRRLWVDEGAIQSRDGRGRVAILAGGVWVDGRQLRGWLTGAAAARGVVGVLRGIVVGAGGRMVLRRRLRKLACRTGLGGVGQSRGQHLHG